MADQNESYFSNSSADDLGELDVREFARATHIISIWLAGLSVRSGVRSYIDALIGLSDGEDSFTCTDIDIVAYACPEEFIDADIKLEAGKQSKSIKTLQARVRSVRRYLIEAQTRADVTLIQVMPGDKIRGKQIPTQYDMILFEMMRDAQRRIMKRAVAFNKNPQQVLTEIAMAVLRERKGAGIPAKIERRKRKPLTRDAVKKIVVAWMERLGYMASQEGVSWLDDWEGINEAADHITIKNRNAIGKKNYDDGEGEKK